MTKLRKAYIAGISTILFSTAVIVFHPARETSETSFAEQEPSLRIESSARGDTFTFKATDGSLDSNVAVITVAATVEQPKAGRLLATDVDSDALTYSVVSPATKGEVAITNPATGDYLYTPWAMVTLIPENVFEAYTLQRSLDLVAWQDIASAQNNVPVVDRIVSQQQFYRLSKP